MVELNGQYFKKKSKKQRATQLSQVERITVLAINGDMATCVRGHIVPNDNESYPDKFSMAVRRIMETITPQQEKDLLEEEKSVQKYKDYLAKKKARKEAKEKEEQKEYEELIAALCEKGVFVPMLACIDRNHLHHLLNHTDYYIKRNNPNVCVKILGYSDRSDRFSYIRC